MYRGFIFFSRILLEVVGLDPDMVCHIRIFFHL